jgi:hypothetical protein
MESEDEEETCRRLLANAFDTERLVAEAMENQNDPDFEPGEEEEEEVPIARFVKKRGVGRDFSANYKRMVSSRPSGVTSQSGGDEKPGFPSTERAENGAHEFMHDTKIRVSNLLRTQSMLPLRRIAGQTWRMGELPRTTLW